MRSPPGSSLSLAGIGAPSAAADSFGSWATQAPSAPVFVCVDCVVRSRPGVEALDHAVHLIKSYLDVSRVSSVAVAARSQSLEVLRLAAFREKRKLAGWSSDLVRAYRQFQFAAAMNVLAGLGSVEGMMWLRQAYYPKGRLQGAERAALWHGQLHVLEFLHTEWPTKVEEDATDATDAIARVAAQGRMDIVEWVVESKGPYAVGWGAMDAAAADDHMDIVLYLDGIVGNRCTRRGLELAALNGHVSVVIWLHENRYELRHFRMLENAIRGGHLPVVQYIMQNVALAVSWVQDSMKAAVRFGQVQVLEWVHEFTDQEIELRTSWLFDVARDGHLGVLQWLHDRGHDVHCSDAFVIRGAAAGGHRHIIEWVYANYRSTPGLGVSPSRICVDGAATNNHLALLKWLHSKHYHLSSTAMDEAAANGHLQIVKWLQTNCPDIGASKAAMDAAAANGYLEIVKFLHQKRKEGCTKAAMDAAALNGHLDIVRFLHNNRGEYCSARAGESLHLPVLEFLRFNRRLRDRLPSSVAAAKRGDLDLLQWIHRNYRKQFDLDAVVVEARAGPHFHVLRWLEILQTKPSRR